MFSWELVAALLDKGKARQVGQSQCQVGAACRLLHYDQLVEVSCGHGVRAAQWRPENHAGCVAQPSPKLLCGSLTPKCSRVSLVRINTAAQEKPSPIWFLSLGEEFGTGTRDFETAGSTVCLLSKPTQGWSWPWAWVGVLKIRRCFGTISQMFEGCHFTNTFMLSWLLWTTQLKPAAVGHSWFWEVG